MRCKRVFEAVKLACAYRKGPITFQKLDSSDFWQTVNSILNKGKSVIPLLFNDTEVLSSIWRNIIRIEFTDKNSLDNSTISVPASPPRTIPKLRNFPVTPKMVKHVLTDRNSSKASDPDEFHLWFWRFLRLNVHAY